MIFKNKIQIRRREAKLDSITKVFTNEVNFHLLFTRSLAPLPMRMHPIVRLGASETLYP